MKTVVAVAMVLAAAVLVVLVYGVWFLRTSVADRTRVVAHIKPSGDRTIDIVVSTEDARSPVRVTELSLSRALRDELGLAPPDGFVEQPLPLTAEEQRDPEAVADAARYNRETVRYVGALTVPPNHSAVLVFKVERKTGSGVIQLQHERKIGFGGSIGFASVQFGTAGPGREK